MKTHIRVGDGVLSLDRVGLEEERETLADVMTGPRPATPWQTSLHNKDPSVLLHLFLFAQDKGQSSQGRRPESPAEETGQGSCAPPWGQHAERPPQQEAGKRPTSPLS